MNCLPLSINNACIGVLVRERRTVQNSRSGASNVFSIGEGTVRFQNE